MKKSIRVKRMYVLNEKIVKELDKVSKKLGMDRSAFVRIALQSAFRSVKDDGSIVVKAIR